MGLENLPRQVSIQLDDLPSHSNLRRDIYVRTVQTPVYPTGKVTVLAPSACTEKRICDRATSARSRVCERWAEIVGPNRDGIDVDSCNCGNTMR
jgi:hypothetical protein